MPINYTDEFINKSRLTMKDKDRMNDWVRSMSVLVNGFEGKRILEVGCDQQGSLIKHIADNFGPLDAIGLNLVATDSKVSPNCRLQKGDIRRTLYEDCFFDVIISSSAFEHISDLHIAVSEMYRILKPGGFLFSHFGPVWSTSYGHHMWITHEGKTYNYWNLILPPYCHLLMNHRELLAMLINSGFDKALSEKVADYVFLSEDQNHLFFEDYEHIIRMRSRFEIIFLKGYDNYDLNKIYNKNITPSVLAQLRDKFPNYREFLYDGITMLLVK